MVTILPKEDDWADVFRKLGAGAVEGYTNRSDEMALQNAIAGLAPDATPRQILDAVTNTKTYGNEAKQQLFKNYLGAAEFEEMQRKSKKGEEIAQEKNRIAALGKKEPTDAQATKQNYLASGYPEYEADLLVNPDVTPATKQQIAKQHADLTARGLRQPMALERTETAQEASIDQNEPVTQIKPEIETESQQEALNQVAQQVAPKPEWPDLPPPPETTPAEREKWRDKNQTFNNKLLQETKEKNKSHTNAEIRYGRAAALNDSHKLPSGLGRLVIDPVTGEPRALASLAGIVNKETQNFVKNINDFLIDAKNYFGGRVTNFDLTSFKSRLPTLMNTEDGRRLIIEQMKLMSELEAAHDRELEKGLKHYGRNASYSDIQRIVDDNVADKQANIIGKINNLDTASGFLDLMANDPKYKDHKLMQSPEGVFQAAPKSKIEGALKRGWKLW